MQSNITRRDALHRVDSDYHFGRPKLYLSAHDVARLTLLRSRLGDTATERAAESLPTLAPTHTHPR